MSGLTQESLKSQLAYDQETGLFHWMKKRGRQAAGSVAGSESRNGYITIRLAGRLYLAHRLAYLYIYGSLPAADIDHANGNKSDNRLTNLRAATRAQNTFNVGLRRSNTSGYKGVSWNSERQKYEAYGFLDGKKKALGRYDTAEQAAEAYRIFAAENHKEFTHRSVYENPTDQSHQARR